MTHRLGHRWSPTRLTLATLCSLGAAAPSLAQQAPPALVRTVSAEGALVREVSLDKRPHLVQSVRVPGLVQGDRILVRAEVGAAEQGRLVGRLRLASGTTPQDGRSLVVRDVAVAGLSRLTVAGQAEVVSGDGGLVNLVVEAQALGAKGAQVSAPIQLRQRAHTQVDALVLGRGWERYWERSSRKSGSNDVRASRVQATEQRVVLSLPLGRVRAGDVIDVTARVPLAATGQQALQLTCAAILTGDRGGTSGERVGARAEMALAAGGRDALVKVGALTVGHDVPGDAFLNLVVSVGQGELTVESKSARLEATHYGRAAIQTTPPYEAGLGGYVAFRAPTLAVTQRGAVLAFCGGHRDGHEDEGDIDVVLRRSTDGGRTWEKLRVIEDHGKDPCKVACPVVLPSGRILLVWCRSDYIGKDESLRTTRQVFVTHSDDDGKTWTKSREITGQVYRKDWRWYGTGPCHGIVKTRAPHKGRIVIPARHNSTTTRTYAHVIYSDDGGDTWQIGGSALQEQTSESTVVELSTGELMLNSRNQSGKSNHRTVSLSRDGGATFHTTYVDAALVEPRGCQASLLRHSFHPQTGKAIVLFSNPRHPSDRTNGTIQLSEDDGRTWTRGLRYAGAPPKFSGYSDLALINGGDVAVLFESGGVPEQKKDRYQGIDFKVVRLADFTALPPVPRDDGKKDDGKKK